MMHFIETLYADPLLKFLVDTTLKSFVICAVAGLFVFCAPWLIARDGTLISREASGVKLERLVVEALQGKVENE